MKKLNLILALSIALMTSCTTQHAITTKTTDIYGAGVVQKTVVADLEVKEEKVSGTSNGKGKQVTNDLKNEAIADAVKKANADVLVEPRFESTIKGRKINVTVTGFPATYKNFHTIKSDEVELLKAGKLHQAAVMDSNHTKTKGGKAVLLLSLGVVMIVSLFLAVF